MLSTLTSFATQTGIPLWLFVIIITWTAIWKLLGMWKAARNAHVFWFIAMAILNTVGIIPIIYIYVFSKWGKKKQNSKTKIISPKKKSAKKKTVKKKSKK